MRPAPLFRPLPLLAACLLAASTARAELSSQRVELFVPQSYGTHYLGDVTGNGLKDAAFLTQLGEGNERGVLTLFTQDRWRRFGPARRFQAPPGSREVHILDMDGDGANELLLLRDGGISRMSIEEGELRRDTADVPIDWPEDELGDPVLLSASWAKLAEGEPPMLALPTIGAVGLFRWSGERYVRHAVVRVEASAFDFGLNMGTMAGRLTNYQRDDGSLGANIESRRYILVLPPIYFLDMDGDGDLDMVVCSPSRARLSIHLNPGDARFAELPDKRVDLSSVTPEEALAGWVSERCSLQDFNADGLPDLLAAKRGDQNSREVVKRSIHLATGPLEYSRTPSQEINVESIASQTVLRDFNGDGLLDMAFPVARINISSLLTTGLTGSFRYVVRFFIQKPGTFFDKRPDYALNFNCDMSSMRETNGPFYVFEFDLTGDGANDLAIINDLENLEVYKGDANGRFGRSPEASLKVERGVISIFEDMDNDGVPDFINIKQEQTSREFRFVIDFLNR